MTISESFALEALRRNRPTARIGPSLCDPKSLKHPRAKNSSRQLMRLGLSWPMEFRDSFLVGIGNIWKHYKDIKDVTKIIFDDSYPVAHPLVAKQGFGSNFSQTDP